MQNTYLTTRSQHHLGPKTDFREVLNKKGIRQAQDFLPWRCQRGLSVLKWTNSSRRTGDSTSDTCLPASQAGEGGACTFAGNSVYFDVGPTSAFATFVGQLNLVGTG